MELKLSAFEQFILLAKQIPPGIMLVCVGVLVGIGLALAVMVEELHPSHVENALDDDGLSDHAGVRVPVSHS